MDLRTYLGAIRKSWVLILITTLVGAAAGTALYLSTPKSYATTVDFYVSTPKTEGTNPQSSGQFAESRVNSYIVLLSSEQLGRRIVDATGIDLSPVQLASRIEASAQLNTVIVNATVTDSSPQRSLQIARGLADNFGKMVDELDNAGRQDAIVVINVVSGPTLHSQPVAPDSRLYVGGGLAAGLLLGLLIAVLRELLDTSVRTEESAQRLVGAPVIGNIAYDPYSRRSPLIIGEEAGSVRAESFRQLRTNLQFIDAAKAANVILVTSSVPLEGKTSTTVNLAMTFMEFGERVLVIEADLRRPKVAELLDLPRENGLTNVLAGQVELGDAVQQWGSSHLFVLTSGSTPPNPSELLGSNRMAEVIGVLKHQFDKIVIDSPPVLPVTDAVVASSLAEAVVLVVRHGRTSRSQVAAAARSLHNVGGRLVGSVITMRRSGRAEKRRYGTYPLPESSTGRSLGGDGRATTATGAGRGSNGYATMAADGTAEEVGTSRSLESPLTRAEDRASRGRTGR